MKITSTMITKAVIFFLFLFGSVYGAEENGAHMIKMCLFYDNPSGHARTDPIINRQCASDHVHTFYGPQNFHPNTSGDNLVNTSPGFSTTPFIENQSLYWHPSIYEVQENQDGTKTYTRVNDLSTGPYYRWDTQVLPKTEAFPPEFRMIAYSNQQGANIGGETGGNFFMECCDLDENDEESCTNTVGGVDFPQKDCDFLGLAFAMPTCWNGDLGIDNDHVSHMAYTEDGTVAGACPPGFDHRLPQIQLFVRIINYKGASRGYTLSNGSTVFHVDFMNGWEDGKLQTIIDNCKFAGDGGYNPPCNCAEEFLTKNQAPSGAVCDVDVRRLIIDEPIDIVSILPRGTCQGDTALIDKSWDVDPPITTSCSFSGGGGDGGVDSEDGTDNEDEGDADEGDEEDGDEEDEDEEDEDGEVGEEDNEDEDDDEETYGYLASLMGTIFFCL